MSRFLVDQSALVRMPRRAVRRRLAPIIEAGEASTCAIVDLAVLHSVRDIEEHSRTRQRRALAYTRVPLTEVVFDRAIDVQNELCRTSRNRLPIQDLLVAATAEVAELTLLHYESAYDIIAEVTGQPTEWVVPKGSI